MKRKDERRESERPNPRQETSDAQVESRGRETAKAIVEPKYVNVLDPELEKYEGWGWYSLKIATLKMYDVDISGLHAVVEDDQIVGVGCKEPIEKIRSGFHGSTFCMDDSSFWAKELDLLGLVVLSFLSRKEAITFAPPSANIEEVAGV